MRRMILKMLSRWGLIELLTMSCKNEWESELFCPNLFNMNIYDHSSYVSINVWFRDSELLQILYPVTFILGNFRQIIKEQDSCVYICVFCKVHIFFHHFLHFCENTFWHKRKTDWFEIRLGISIFHTSSHSTPDNVCKYENTSLRAVKSTVFAWNKTLARTISGPEVFHCTISHT